jgi:protein ImuB
MTVADARTIISNLEVLDDDPGLSSKLLKGLAEWCIRYTPAVSIDLPDGLILDASGCAHLWAVKDYISRICYKIKKYWLLCSCSNG